MIDLKNLSNRDIIQLQYNLLEELKTDSSKPIVNDVVGITDCWDYIKQKVTDDEGNIENPSNYLNRLRWFEIGCPTLKELAEYYNLNYKTIRKTSSRFKWKNIQAKAIELGYYPTPSITIDTTESTVKRDDPKYYQFRQSVLNRDKVCQCCGKKEDLEVHHLFSFNAYNHLGADPKNGIALCKECHKRYHSQYGTKKHNNPVTLAQFLRDYGMNAQTTLPDNIETFDNHTTAKLAQTVLKDLEDTFDGECPEEVFKNHMMTWTEFSEDYVEKLITEMINIGIAYRPTKGVVKAV